MSTDYRYRQLEGPTKIRLLVVSQVSSDEQLHCELIHVDLDNAPQYYALSYVWGASSFSQQLCLGTRVLNITESLHHALRDIQTLYQNPELNLHSGPLLVWADAVCIDQANLVEKSKQIPIMTKIFERASSVITYIGPQNDDALNALALIQSLQRFHYYHGNEPTLDFSIDQDRKLEVFGLPASDDKSWAALRRLLHRPWSGRAWIVQESVVNKNNVMMCGSMLLQDWNILWQIVRLSLNGKLPLYCIIAKTPVHTKDEDMNDGPDHICCLAQLRAYFRSENNLNKTLYQLLQTCHSMASHDPRDKIYALLGMAKDSEILALNPDYTRSVEDVYIETASRLLQSLPNLELFSSVRGDKQFELPSWVPDWSTHTSEFGVRNLLFHTELIKNGLYQASGSLSSDVHFSADGRMLTVTGHTVDTIIVVTQDLDMPLGTQDDNSREEALLVPAVLTSILEHLVTVFKQGPYNQTCGIQEALWRTLIANVTDAGREATAEYESRFLTYVKRNLDLLDSKNQALVNEFVQAAGVVASGWTLGITKSGYLGLVPVLIQPGDLICVLHGGCVPYVLRNGEGGRCSLIGDAYVHGIKKGEFLASTPAVERFTIA